jgi:cardiolipin synthase
MMTEGAGTSTGRMLPAVGGATATGNRVVTVPNLISLVRLACIPVFLWLLFVEDNRYGAAWLLAVLGCTDWVDGYIARRWNQVSTLGKVLDPTADRLLLGVGIAAILIDGSVPPWIAWLVIIREVLVSGAVLALAAVGARRIDVQWVGKAGTFGLMVAFPLFLVQNADVNWSGIAGVVAWVVVLPSLALSWYAAATYVPLAREALREGRVGSAR